MVDSSGPPHPHGHAHSHSHERISGKAFAMVPAVRYLTLGLLVLVAGATVWGLVALWPDYSKAADLAERANIVGEGVTYVEGEIMDLSEGCDGISPSPANQVTAPDTGQVSSTTGVDSGDAAPPCLLATVGLRSGPDTGRLIEAPVRGGLVSAGLRPGDRVELISYSSPAPGTGTADEDGSSYEVVRTYSVSGVFRHLPLAILALLFAAVVVAVGRIRGLFALVALGISAGVLLMFVLPALVTGGPGLLIGIVGSSAIMFVILYFVHGPSMRTTAALIGTLCGILIISGISLVAVHVTRLSGVGDEAAGLLSAMVSEIDFRGLLTCSILIAGLGVLNDVTITQASAVWELRAAAPAMSRREVYARGMRIGRDHLASTVYTVFFAYVGAALSVLILLYLYNRPMLSLLTWEDIAIEIVRTLCGSIGLVLAIPITTGVATLFLPPAKGEAAEAAVASP